MAFRREVLVNGRWHARHGLVGLIYRIAAYRDEGREGMPVNADALGQRKDIVQDWV